MLTLIYPDSVMPTFSTSSDSCAIGIDVGGPKKGFHAVALEGRRITAKLRTRDPAVLTDWCIERGARVVAVDAPCRWRGPGLARLAERQLAAERISCYYAPTELRARSHSFYSWMLPGAELYARLQTHFPLYLGTMTSGPATIETFPQAVSCALAGQRVSAKDKRSVRRAILDRAGIDTGSLGIIDEIDATLCALTAACFAAGDFKYYGDAADGFIIVPRPQSP